jgi:hypothetical protein
VLVTAVFAAVAVGTAWAEQSNGPPQARADSANRTVRVGAVVDMRIDASDPDQDRLRFSVPDGALPNGLSLDTRTGKIAGVVLGPARRYPVTVTVVDARGATTRAAFAITVKPPA